MSGPVDHRIYCAWPRRVCRRSVFNIMLHFMFSFIFIFKVAMEEVMAILELILVSFIKAMTMATI